MVQDIKKEQKVTNYEKDNKRSNRGYKKYNK